MDHCKLNFLTDNLKLLQKLIYLDLSNNYFKFIPNCIEDLGSTLKWLDLSNNFMELEHPIYDHFGSKFTQLIQLNLANMKIRFLSESSIIGLNLLQSLNLDENKVS